VTQREHDTLVRNLSNTLGISPADLIQTHISSVIATGDTVYKLKKPVDFGFLDYSTLERRKHFCEEEVRINSRFAPQLYMGVVAVTGSVEYPQLGGEGDPIEYAVKMHRFAPEEQLDTIVTSSGLTDGQCDAIADSAAMLHAGAVPVENGSDFGSPERVLAPMTENFDLMASLERNEVLSADVSALKAWTEAEHARLKPILIERRRKGCIRECHGDLHLHNMAIYRGNLLLFDAIEFNPYLNHIDVISDLAFLLMDLEYRGLFAQSRRILNRYLEHTGDYAAVALLPFYKTYRAMVRAKVLALHASQQVPDKERESLLLEIRRYIALAKTYGEKGERFLVITHGLSGAGKSTFALDLVEQLGALRLRSDVERMRLFPRKEGTEDIYTAEATKRTYARLESLAEAVLRGGVPVVADATFLRVAYRRQFRILAERLGLPLLILDITCDDAELKRRLRRRVMENSDVSEADIAVLETQKRFAEPLKDEEKDFVMTISCSESAVAEKVSVRFRLVRE